MSQEYLNKLFGMEGKTVVVIGGTGVLGGAIAEGIAQAGAHVVIAGRNQENGNARVEAIQAAGGEASFLPVDVSHRKSINGLLEATLAAHGSVYGLVNCAGVNSATPYFEIEDAEFVRIMQSNLLATHQACQIFGEKMVAAGEGAILNIGSVTSDRPLSRVYAYSCSKAAVLSLTRNVGRELAPKGVRVNCLCPGFFPAEQNRKILDESRVASIMEHTPMARFGEPEELVGAAILLLSPVAGKYMSSTAIYVDGGFTAITI